MKSNNLGLPILGGLLAAVAGAAIWAIIAILTEYEIGIVAWAIGGLSGLAVIFFAKQEVNNAHQFIAVISSLLGIFLGKYFIFGYYFNNGDLAGLVAGETIVYFQQFFSSFFEFIDIIFILLAVVTAWQLPGKLVKEATPVNSNAEAAE
ncbi:hypothetical protein E3U55_01795 [Filobacillus milosensis]|uniref:Uncharacterized protein n=1 Tax=Filobacillus milosensis TaxID=94137 RepID=A0A4Y8IT83_9BACI|nr:hypothetical protein [Filobacillus milosensis]TFB24259.1 hypothetical protein E3U55_01795 [Filobacillus milosensis]